MSLKFKNILQIIIISFFLSPITHAWVEPSDTSNIAAPINTGFMGQSKAGGMILNTGGAGTGLLIPNGNVGIGTSNPQGTLDVSGNVCINGDCRNGWPSNSIWGQNGSNIYYNNSGNVGIGTTNPTTKLQVLGKSNFSRDGVTECCGNDATITIGENTAGTGKRASISFHNGGAAEGTLELAPSGTRRLKLYDNQGQGMGLETTGNITTPGVCLGGDCLTQWCPTGYFRQWRYEGTAAYYICQQKNVEAAAVSTQNYMAYYYAARYINGEKYTRAYRQYYWFDACDTGYVKGTHAECYLRPCNGCGAYYKAQADWTGPEPGGVHGGLIDTRGGYYNEEYWASF